MGGMKKILSYYSEGPRKKKWTLPFIVKKAFLSLWYVLLIFIARTDPIVYVLLWKEKELNSSTITTHTKGTSHETSLGHEKNFEILKVEIWARIFACWVNNLIKVNIESLHHLLHLGTVQKKCKTMLSLSSIPKTFSGSLGDFHWFSRLNMCLDNIWRGFRNTSFASSEHNNLTILKAHDPYSDMPCGIEISVVSNVILACEIPSKFGSEFFLGDYQKTKSELPLLIVNGL